ncbi:GGDEF domain-containing protein [Sulfurimonas sp. SAG-AH-194-I05]|nr:GGDEF domain-containing protein [Sulfurimonas sp. SAG-AH-194-I05]MDF1875471.1 GGDEF domain-containing protein [Sulfurimonas sp. SAG-AH-194-I05]
MLSQPIFQAIINSIPNPIIITNGNKIFKSNDIFIDFFHYKNLDDFMNENSCVCNLFIEDDAYFSLASIDENISWVEYIHSSEDTIRVKMLNKKKEFRVFHITINIIEQEKNYFLVVFTDITALENEKTMLENMAYKDPLTGIYNRQMFNRFLLKESENKKRHGDVLSLIMFDIDHFKRVNDTYGHDVGDQVLITLCKLITDNLRVNDIFARWGGEEFMILLPRTELDTAFHKSLELKQIVEDYDDEAIPHITLSFGVTEIRMKDKERSCFKRVDEALYKAKVKRNDVVKL